MAGVFPFAWLLPFGFGVPALVVEGTADCPAPAAVSAELSAIMRLPEVETPGDRAVVSNRGDEVSVGLFSATGAVLGERRVSAPGSCEEKARAVAVILATWLTDAHPELKAQLPSVTPPAPPSPEPAPAPEPPPPPVRQAPQPSPATASVARRVRDVRSLSFTASAGVELSSAGAAPALELSTRFAPAGTGLGVLGFVLTAVPAERELGSGTVRWFRWPLGIGPLLRLAPRGVFVDLALGPTVAWLHLEGQDFTGRNDDADAALFGGFAGVNVAGTSGPVRPCAGAGLLVWPGTSTAVASAPDAELDLPAVEGTLTLGVVFAP